MVIRYTDTLNKKQISKNPMQNLKIVIISSIPKLYTMNIYKSIGNSLLFYP